MSDTKPRLKGHTALITGAGRGIGRAVALAFAREGAALALCSRTFFELDETAKQAEALGAELFWRACDVSKPKDVARFVRDAANVLGPIDVLVNNAGLLGPRAPLVDYPEAQWRAVIDVNLHGVFLMTKAVLPSMLEHKRGVILNVSSGVGRKAKGGWGAYAVSKFGLEGLTQLIAAESENGVRALSVNPGPTRTTMRAAAYPQEDPLTLKVPEAVGEAFIELALNGANGAQVDLDENGQMK